jgi:G:T-mismatch repair DNA endonuclease (very short patch repair protein)
MKKLTQEQFLEKCFQKHGNKFDYSKINYEGFNKKVEIICFTHGSSWQTPSSHLNNIHGCNLCSPTGGAALTQEQFIEKCKILHKNTYDYSKTIFTGVKNKILIICSIHGEFEQIAEKHFLYGCSACAGNKRKTQKEFLNQAKIVHKNYYNYDQINFISNSHKIIINCPKHGQFIQSPKNHLLGQGCKKCGAGNTSNIEHKWLDHIDLPDDNLHRNVTIYIGNKKFIVDGYVPNTNLIYEFLGDYWHGNPSIYNQNKINKANKKSFGDLFKNTVERIRTFRKAGFKVISIWEKDFKNEQKKISNRGKSLKISKNTRVLGK